MPDESDTDHDDSLDAVRMFLFRVLFNEDRTRIDTEHDVMGWGTRFPSGECFVDWNREAYAPDDRLDNPHVSIYGSFDDVEQGTGGDVELLHEQVAHRTLDDEADADLAGIDPTDADRVGRARKKPVEVTYRGPYTDPTVVETIEGDFEVDDDYIDEHGGYVIIRGVEGEEYPCGLDIFEETYERL